jgi:tetratricopeptide (TPR) repeat protein
MLNHGAVTILWWTIPFRLCFWFVTAFASSVGLLEFGQDFVLPDDVSIKRAEQIPISFVISSIAVGFLTKERILNAQKTQREIHSLKSQLETISSEIGDKHDEQFERLKTRSEKLAEYGVDLDPESVFNLGHIAYNSGRLDDSRDYLSEAKRRFASVGDDFGVACAIGYLGQVAFAKGEVDIAEMIYRESIDSFNRLENKDGVQEMFCCLGFLYQAQGNLQQADDEFMMALELAREYEDKSGESAAINGLGTNALTMGSLESALDYFQESLEIARITNNIESIGNSLNNIGEVLRNKKQFSEATEYYNKTLQLSRTEGIKMMELYARNNLALISLECGKTTEALVKFTNLINELREIGVPEMEATVLSNIGLIHMQEGRTDEAIGIFGEARVLANKISSHRIKANLLNNLGACYFDGDMKSAKIAFEECLVELEAIGDELGMALPLTNLGVIALENSQLDESEEHLLRSLEMKRKSGGGDEFVTLRWLGKLFIEKQEFARAYEWFQQCLGKSAEIEHPWWIACSNYEICNVLFLQGEHDRAKEQILSNLPLIEVVDDWNLKAESLVLLAMLAEVQNEPEEQRRLNTHAVQIWRDNGVTVPEWYIENGY